MADFLVQASVCNNKGRIRGNNEDNFFLNGTYMPREKVDDGASLSIQCKDETQLYAVCDGMGGIDAGEDASFCAVSALSGMMPDYRNMVTEERLIRSLREVSDTVYREAQQRGQRSGTTIAMVFFNDNKVMVSNVGDSRVYLFRGGKLKQISIDHSKVQRMISMGLLTPEQAKKDPSRHVISQYLGMAPDVLISPYVDKKVELQENDVFLLCSDGLSDMVEDDIIERILQNNEKTPDAAGELLSEALRMGGHDNTTVMVLNVLKNVKAEKTEKPARKKSGSRMRTFLTAAQMVIGGWMIVMIIDLIYYLLH